MGFPRWQEVGEKGKITQPCTIFCNQKGGSQQKGMGRAPPSPEMAVHSLIARFQVPQDCRRTFLQG